MTRRDPLRTDDDAAFIRKVTAVMAMILLSVLAAGALWWCS